MKQPPKPGGFEDWGSDFANSAQRKASSSGLFGRRRDSFDQDSFAKDSDDELDLLAESASRHSSKASKDSRNNASNGQHRREPSQGVAFFVDGHLYEPHPDYTVDGKQRLKGMKFKKNKKNDSETSATSSSVLSASKPCADAPAAPNKPTGHPIESTKAGSSRRDPLHKPFRPPTRVVAPAESSRRAPQPLRKREPSASPIYISLSDEDIDRTPRPPKSQAKPRPVKEDKDILSALDDALPPLPEADREDRKQKGRARASDWPMDNVSPLKGSGIGWTSKSNCPLDQLSPLKESSNARSHIRPFPLDQLSPIKDENSVFIVEDWEKSPHTSPPNSQASKDKSSIRAVQSFPAMSPLSSPAKPPSSSTQGSNRSSQDSRRKKGEKGKSRPRRPQIVESSDDSNSEIESPVRRPTARPFPMATQVLESIRSPSAKRGSSDAEEASPWTERREKKRVRGADEMYVPILEHHTRR